MESNKYKEFALRYRMEFVYAAIVFMIVYHVFYTGAGKWLVKLFVSPDTKDYYKTIYNVILITLGAAVFMVAQISYPKIYKFKILLTGFAVMAYFTCILLIINRLPSDITIMNVKLDFVKKAWDPASDYFTIKFLMTMFSANLLGIMLSKSTVSFKAGKIAGWAVFWGNLVLFVAVLNIISGKFSASDTASFAYKFTVFFNKYFIAVNVLIIFTAVAASVFSIEEEHNYGSIIAAVLLINLYCVFSVDQWWPVRFILPFIAVIILWGMFSHWLSCLHHKAHYDPLLKIYNRQYLDAVLSGVTEAGIKKEFSILMCDIDHFKKVNDTYGHAAGDAVLYATAQTIRNAALPEGIVCRYGGEEITVVLRGKTGDDAFEKAEKIRKAVKKNPVKFKSKGIKVTMSIGIGTAKDGTREAQKAIKRADDNVYKAKKRGRDRVVME